MVLRSTRTGLLLYAVNAVQILNVELIKKMHYALHLHSHNVGNLFAGKLDVQRIVAEASIPKKRSCDLGEIQATAVDGQEQRGFSSRFGGKAGRALL